MTRLTKIVALLLALSMLFSVVACVASDDSKQTTETKGTPSTTGKDETTAVETTDAPHADPGLPQKKFQNETYMMYGSSTYVDTYGAQRDLVPFEDIETNNINEAVRDRNNYIQDMYEVTIKATFVDSGDIKSNLTKAESGNMVLCNMFTCSLSTMGSLIEAGYVKDINSEMGSYLNLTQDYWDEKCRDSMSIMHRLYMITGDIITCDKEATWNVCFNRDIVSELNLDNPYDLVDNYQWTTDRMYAMSQAASDYDSHEPTDWFGIRWGLLSESYNSYAIWQGCGAQMIVKDAVTDRPMLTELTDTMYENMMDVAAMQFDQTCTLFASRITGVADTCWDGVVKIFKDGGALFSIGSISMAEWLRDREMDFGVLPMPMANDSQNFYCTSLSGNCTFVLGFQRSLGRVSDGSTDMNVIDFTSIITEALCCESSATLQEAYYDKTLVYKGLRREEDAKMLKLVFDSRVFDLCWVFSWADALTADLGTAKSESRIKRLKSSYDGYARGTEKAIASFLTKHGMA